VLHVDLPGPVLGITAAGPSAVGLIGPGVPDLQLRSEQPQAHVESLIPLVKAVLGQAGLEPAALAAVAVGTGPAPYTGLRVGLATARALAFALDRPVWGVSDLDVLAADAVSRLNLQEGLRLLVATDAKRQEVYWARYQVEDSAAGEGLTLLEGPAVGAPEQVPAAEVVVGEGAAKYSAVLGPPAGDLTRVDPVVLARLAAWRAAQGQDLPSDPLYLRRPHVQVPGAPKRAT
jgi:tRNA threonylcarbamoyladenosine biosynthesis protein TsaB